MSKLFLFSLIEIFTQISLDLIVLIVNTLIIILSAVCVVLSIAKEEYGVKNRLWIVFFMVGISLVQLWIELSVIGQAKNFFLTIGISVCILALILFLPQKSAKIPEEGRNLARLISEKVKKQAQEGSVNTRLEKSRVFSSPIIKTEQRSLQFNEKNEDDKKSEIDFSHVKSVLNKLEYYPLKEQDKKQARELENAIITAEEMGINYELKEKINDGLGALLKIMSKYAI